MARSVPLSLTQLEAREVPSAALVADVRAGIWGSYPLNLTPSGGALYFSADNGHGYELYRTSGEPGDFRMVKDIKPGVGGSNPMNVLAADGGVVYFTADDGTGRALWRSDGTTTAKVPGVPANAVFDNTLGQTREAALGVNGKLYFTVQPLGPYTGTHFDELWVTNGTSTTRLTANLGYAGNGARHSLTVDGNKVVVNRFEGAFAAQWTTDGTPAGTRRVQLPVYVSPAPGIGTSLMAGVPLAPGKYIHPMNWNDGNAVTVWASDGLNPSSVKLLASIDIGGSAEYSAKELYRLGDKVYFVVQSSDPQKGGLWATDGTAAGTQRIDIPAFAGTQVSSLRMFGGKLLVHGGNVTGQWRYYLSDGTAAGTAEVPLPEAPTQGPYSLIGEFPSLVGYPGGALVFKLGSQGRLYITTGTEGGWADMAGLPSSFSTQFITYPTDTIGRSVSESAQRGVVFNGEIYFQAANGEQRAELWKWNPFTNQVPPQEDPPIVVGTSVNNGAAQRSTVTSLTVSFDRPVNIEDGALQLRDATGKVHLLYVESPVQGQASLNIHFGGKSLPDGRYTLTVKGGKVTDAETGAALGSDYTYQFTRLFGDLNGDGVYDRDTRTLVRNALGSVAGDPRYAATLDVNMDGKIDATDELSAVRNWGKSV
jgi:ELWxxDGT repeat protein